MIDANYVNPGNRTTNGPRSVENRDITAGFQQRLERESRTVGWRPTCQCGAAVTPATVLDPFGGSCTTICAALDLGRKAIAVELSEEYAKIADRRIKLRGVTNQPKQVASAAGQRELFG